MSARLKSYEEKKTLKHEFVTVNVKREKYKCGRKLKFEGESGVPRSYGVRRSPGFAANARTLLRLIFYFSTIIFRIMTTWSLKFFK